MTAMNGVAAPLLFVTFLLLLAGMWWGITHTLAEMAGWPDLQRRFPGRHDTPWLTLRGRSGRMGKNVSFNGMLTFGAGPSGLRIKIPWLFAAGGEPITVPWAEIKATALPRKLIPAVRLSFGAPEVGSLTLHARLWERLSERAPLAERLPPVPMEKIAKSMVASWISLTLFAGTFFMLVSRADGSAGLSAATAYGFPGAVFGVLLLWEYLRP